jgi:hypothetical protein|tara:strand:- start:542 stop:925 length:384 start_codon:yes stop_codon:yes gene_type:complete
MAKVEKTVVTPMWVKIKEMYEEGTNGSDKYGTNFEIGGELDNLSNEFLELLGEITLKEGYGDVIEEIKLDLWKERIWLLIENAGLLPEISWRDDKESDRRKIEDTWVLDEEEYSYDIDSKSHEAYKH